MRQSPLYEVLGQLGMWGMVVSGVQASILEHQKMRESTWNSANSLLSRFRFGVSSSSSAFLVTLLLAYTAGAYFVAIGNITLIFTTAMFVMYTIAPLLYRLASSTYYNLSLRSASFYGLLFGTSQKSNSA